MSENKVSCLKAAYSNPLANVQHYITTAICIKSLLSP